MNQKLTTFFDEDGQPIEVAFPPIQPLDDPESHVSPFHPQTVPVEIERSR